MKDYFDKALTKLKNEHEIDVVEDILLGKNDRVLLYADVSHVNHIIMHVIHNDLKLVGLDSKPSLSLQDLVSYIDYNNRYCEVAGHDAYHQYLCDRLFNFNKDMNITFPIIYNNQRTWVHIDGFKVEKNPKIYVFYLSNLSTLMEREEAIYDKTHKDSLTKLFNTYSFDYHYGLRYQIEDIHILYLDLDNFKVINDTFGHHVGNDVLVTFSKILKSYDTDLNKFYRLGGDEFIGMYFEKTETILNMAREILEKTKTIKIKGYHHPITVSIGILKGTIREDMARKADDLLYQAKKLGKDQFVFDIET